MNKKVLSAILFSALFAGTGTFTSCIDNDEPAGIEELRGAKADLLRAQKLVAEADAAFRLAEAEVEKAKAAKKMAEAKIAEAQAEFEAARADSMNSAAGMAELRYQEALANYERAAEIAMKQHELDIIAKDSAIAVAERQFQIAAAQIKIAQALMSEEATLELDSLIAKRDTSYARYLVASNDYEQKYAEYLNDLAYYNVDSTYAIRKAEINLESKKASLTTAEENLAKLEKYLNSDSIYNAETWRKEIADLEKKIADYDKQIAVFAVDSGRKWNSEDYKKLVLAEEAATAAINTEKDSLRENNFVLTEDVVDTLLYTTSLPTGQQKNENFVVSFDKGTYKLGNQGVVATLAGSSYLTFETDTTVVKVAEKFGTNEIIAKLQAEHDSYTTERIYWLDSIKNISDDVKEEASKGVEGALKAWQDSLNAYNSAKNFSLNAIYNPTDGKGAVKTYLDEMAAAATANDKDAKEAAAKKKFAGALVAAYNAIPAAQRAYNAISLPVPGKTDGTHSSGDIVTFLSDASYQVEYLDAVLTYFSLADKTTVSDFEALWTEGTKATATAGKADSPKATAVFASMIQKEVLDADKKYTNDNFDSAGNGKTLLGKLINASTKAFGSASQYVNTSDFTGTKIVQNGYLRNKPSNADVKHVVATLMTSGKTEEEAWSADNIGLYGASLASSDVDVYFVANNHVAIKADLKAAIDKWTALVNEIVEETKAGAKDVKDAKTACTAANKAKVDFGKAIAQEYNKNTAGLEFSKTYWQNQLVSLKAAVNAFLDVKVDGQANNYQGEESFKTWLKSQISTLEGIGTESIWQKEKDLAMAEAKLAQYKEGNFDQGEIANEIAEAAEDLADAEVKLAACKKNYEMAQADFEKAWKVWSEIFAAE